MKSAVIVFPGSNVLTGWLRRGTWAVIVVLFLAPPLVAAGGGVQGENGTPDIIALNCSRGFDVLRAMISSLEVNGGFQKREKLGMDYFHRDGVPFEYFVTPPSHPAYPAVYLYTLRSGGRESGCVSGTHTVGCGFGDAKAFFDQLEHMPKEETFRLCAATRF